MRFPSLDATWEQTHERLQRYCSKEKSRLAPGKTVGEYPKQSATKFGSEEKNLDDWALEIVNNKISWAQAFQDAPGFTLRYHKHVEEIRRKIRIKPVRREKMVVLYQGKAGIGKTSWIEWTYGPDNVYAPICTLGTKAWWDGYEGQPVVVIDEFSGQWPITELNKLFDRKPARVEIKGTTDLCAAHTFFITSNKGPTEWWPDNCYTPEQMKGLLRRITFRMIDEVPNICEPFPIFPPDELPEPKEPRVMDKREAKLLNRGIVGDTNPAPPKKKKPAFMKKK